MIKRAIYISFSFAIICVLFSCTKYDQNSNFRLRSVKHILCKNSWKLSWYRSYDTVEDFEKDEWNPETGYIDTFNIHFDKNGSFTSAVKVKSKKGLVANPDEAGYSGFYEYSDSLQGNWRFEKGDKTTIYLNMEGVDEKFEIVELNKGFLKFIHFDKSGKVERISWEAKIE